MREMIWVSHSPRVSGAEKVMFGLMELATAQGWRVSLASPLGPIVAAMPRGVDHIDIPPLGLTGETGIRRVFALVTLIRNIITAGLRIRRPSKNAIIVVNSLYALPALRFAGRRRPRVWLVHDTLTYPKQRATVRFSRSLIDRAVAVSAATAEPLLGMGLQTVVQYNGVRVDAQPFPKPLAAPPVVGVLAAITPWKGQDVAIEALAHLPGVHLELAGSCFPGEQWFLDQLEARAAEPDVAGRIRFLGHSDAGECLRRWDALVSPSVAPEAGPIGVLESMSAGTPVVATRHGGSAEYLADGRGVLVTPADAVDLARGISDVLTDDARRADMISMSWSRVVGHHDITKVQPDMLAALTDLDRESPRP